MHSPLLSVQQSSTPANANARSVRLTPLRTANHEISLPYSTIGGAKGALISAMDCIGVADASCRHHRFAFHYKSPVWPDGTDTSGNSRHWYRLHRPRQAYQRNGQNRSPSRTSRLRQRCSYSAVGAPHKHLTNSEILLRKIAQCVNISMRAATCPPRHPIESRADTPLTCGRVQ